MTLTLDQIGKGNLDQEITSDYNGDFVNIKLVSKQKHRKKTIQLNHGLF